LGDSLELCKEECRIEDAELPSVAIAEFGLTQSVRLLDFGYRPSALAQIAGANSARLSGSNPDLEDFLVNYCVCWPLLAASSIKVAHEKSPFVEEYIVPQMILQWAMSSSECDGIRYFSSRFDPEPRAIRGTVNYVFPATNPTGANQGHSDDQKNKFEFTDAVIWGPQHVLDLRHEALRREADLHELPKSALR
jgi:hypothetical protein